MIQLDSDFFSHKETDKTLYKYIINDLSMSGSTSASKLMLISVCLTMNLQCCMMAHK